MSRPADGHQRFEEDLAAYLLGSLDGAERIAFEAHLDQCERCRTDLDWLRPTVGELAMSAPQVEPPRRLRRRTLAAARADGRTTVPGRWPARFGLPRLAAAGAAVAAVAAVAIAIAVLGNGSGPGSTTVPVESNTAAISGSLVVDGGTATLQVARMPRLPSDEVYEAWIQRDGEIEPSSTFIVDRNGSGAAAIPGVHGADRVMVTREPRGGSDRPSTAPLLEASL